MDSGNVRLRLRRMLRSATLTCVLGMACGVAAQPVTFVEQTRSVRALNESVVSTLPGFFDETVEDSFFDKNTGDFGNARFSQVSEIHNRAITMAGEFDVFGSTDSSASGNSVLEATFELSEPAAFELRMDTFDLVLGKNAGMFASIDLFDSSGVAVASGAWTGLNLTDEVIIDTAGVLPAGRYTLDALVLVSAFKGTSNEGSYSMTFVVPAPGGVGLFVATGSIAWRRRR